MNTTSPLGRVLRVGRIYTLPYLSLSALATAATITSALLWHHLVLIIALPAGMLLGLSAVSDLIHRRADARALRGRDDTPLLLISLALAGLSVAGAAILVGGARLIPGALATIVSSILYAAAKSVPGLSNILRGVAGASLLLLCAAVAGPITPATVQIALAFAIIDAGGNLWGDVRDQEPDTRAGTRTLAVVAPQAAPWVAWGLFGVALALFAEILAFPWLLVLLPLGAMPWRAGRACHLHALVIKYVIAALVAVRVSSMLVPFAIILLVAGLLTIPAYQQIHRVRLVS
ncbi:hypothetical protein K2Z83_02030 [Oscillochloris sp. ZM17-4]|uniref:UbiA family prenyltransferase n=1 Tax=Oscillochloris sp. ZM17-4 TaxID=2866714 RepID=UPI001C72ADD9|nr:UbiA family prenyltransferase [Oscillochloris sp. ZM17-4]MBX0326473.1 hypothetical protein [Oscillochloris sp. ZM17-4]